MQEDQLLPDDPLRGDTAARLREGVRGPESHLVSVHTHALRVWGLRALHVAGGARGRREEQDALPRALAFALGGMYLPLDGSSGRSRSLARDHEILKLLANQLNERILEAKAFDRGSRVIENLLEKYLCTMLDR